MEQSSRFQILLEPPGLRVLARTEALERFAFCGTQLLLLLYLSHTLAVGGGEARIHGLSAVRHGFAKVLGIADSVGFASQFVAIFAALVHLGPIGGACVARRVGRRLTVACGGLIMAAGHFLLSFEAWFLPALLLLAIGAGCTISNKLAQVGTLFDTADRDRSQAFATYTIALNLGALMAPIVCGTLGENGLWAWGFRAAALAMLLGVANYVAGWRHLPHDDMHLTKAALSDVTRTSGMTGLLLACLLPYILVTAVLNQAYVLAILWASTQVDRTVAGFVMPITWVLVVDGLMSILGIVAAAALWKWIARTCPLREMHKLAIGCLVVAVAYLLLTAASLSSPSTLLLFLLFFVILDLGAAWLDPPMEAFFSRHAGASRRNMIMALFKASTAVAALLLGWLGRFYAPLGPTLFWLLNAALAAVALVLALILAFLVARAERRSAARGLHSDTGPDLVVKRQV